MTNFLEFFVTCLLFGLVYSTPTEVPEKKEEVKVEVKAAEPSSTTQSSLNATASSNASKVVEDEIDDEGWEYENQTVVDTRRILYGKPVQPGKRPYMVYLQLTKESAKAHKYRGWLCGGVIVHASYVLTSAACVEDADHFYIVSGTTNYVDSFDYKNDNCVCKHRRRVVWKCIPKNYKFDFQDSIKWSSNDIAIVRVDKPFKLGVCEKGCQFATDLVCYNNISRDLEKAGTKGYIAGWGSMGNFREGVYRRQEPYIPKNAKCLQEAKVCVMDNEQCAKKWAQKFRSIITQYMICTKDVMRKLSDICNKKYANCTDVEETDSRRQENLPEITNRIVNVDLGRHLRDPNDYTARRSTKHGGFCENDHGGPLIVKYQGKERVIGVISACKIDPKSHSCHGPFLYTSLFKNRQFISCSINKDVEESCRRVFRTGITHEEYSVDWADVEEDADDDADKKKESGEIKADDLSSDSDNDEVIQRAGGTEAVTEKAKAAEVKEEKVEKKAENKTEKESKKEEKKEKSSKKHKKKKSKKEGKQEASYESSKDDAVNEPDSE